MCDNQKSLKKLLIATLLSTALPAVVSAAPEVYDIKIVELAGRPGHQGLFPIQGSPVLGSKVIVDARLLSPANEVRLVLKDSNGVVLSDTMMTKIGVDGDEDYAAEITIPMVPFKMSIAGLDAQNTTFEEVPKGDGSVPGTAATAITPSEVGLSLTASNLFVKKDKTVSITVTIPVSNAQGRYLLRMGSSIGKITPASKIIQINSKKPTILNFTYRAPKKIKALTQETITATLTKQTGQSQKVNSGSTKITVQD